MKLHSKINSSTARDDTRQTGLLQEEPSRMNDVCVCVCVHPQFIVCRILRSEYNSLMFQVKSQSFFN